MIRRCLVVTMVTSADSTDVRLLRRRADGEALDRLHLICYTFYILSLLVMILLGMSTIITDCR
jgi:hypothetical protein